MEQELAVNYQNHFNWLRNKEKRNFKVSYQYNAFCFKYGIDIDKMSNCNQVVNYMQRHNFKYQKMAPIYINDRKDHNFKKMIFQKGRVVILLRFDYLNKLYGVNIYRRGE